MGSPSACLWEMLTFSTMKTLALIPKYRKNIIVFKRHVDDVFIIWRQQGEYDDSFNEFKGTLNSISNLD